VPAGDRPGVCGDDPEAQPKRPEPEFVERHQHGHLVAQAHRPEFPRVALLGQQLHSPQPFRPRVGAVRFAPEQERLAGAALEPEVREEVMAAVGHRVVEVDLVAVDETAYAHSRHAATVPHRRDPAEPANEPPAALV
jgi:hypothetical protein